MWQNQLLLVVLPIVGLSLAIAGGLIHRLAHKEGGKTLMWIGIFIAALCGIVLLWGVMTGL